jgi:hypothetical protein
MVRGELSRLLRLACVSITGSLRKAPTAALEVLLSLTPLIRWQWLRPGPQLTTSQ